MRTEKRASHHAVSSCSSVATVVLPQAASVPPCEERGVLLLTNLSNTPNRFLSVPGRHRLSTAATVAEAQLQLLK